MSLESEILSSTGSLGYERRSYLRGYANLPGLCTSEYVLRLNTVADRILRRGEISRCVARVLMKESEIARLPENMQLFEAAVPTTVGAPSEETVWMCMLARNSTSRRPLFPAQVMIEKTNVGKQKQEPSALVTSTRESGYSFVTEVSEEQIGQIYDSWEPVFGWDRRALQVEAFRLRLASDRLRAPENRSVWFTALCDGSEIVTLAMAERLDFPEVAIIELTEWVSKRRGRHLMEATLAHNISQVLDDLANIQKPTLLIAETNFITHAYSVAYGVGMQVPPRQIGNTYIPQLLIQNVSIGDGRSDVPYRDFVMMYLPPTTIEQQYNAEQREVILGRS